MTGTRAPNSKIDPYRDHTRLWADELRDWMPQQVFDGHVHLGPPDICAPFAPDRARAALTSFNNLPWEQARDFYADLYSGKQIVGVIAFGFPLREIDLPAANRYLIQTAIADGRVEPFILADPHDIPGTITQYHQLAEEFGKGFVGVKPYFDLLRLDVPNSVFHCRDIDFTPLPLLEFMDEQGLALMLHTSGNGGGDVHVREFVDMAATRFPRIGIILAHMSRYVQPEQFDGLFYSDVLDHPNVYLETSSASVPRVYELTLSRRDLWDRLIFGSDIPFGLITGTEHWSDQCGPIFLTRDDYTWSDAKLNEMFADERQRMTYNTYHTIYAVKQAMDKLGLEVEEERKLKDAIFVGNARRLLSERQQPATQAT